MPTAEASPLVSVIVVHLAGVEPLMACLDSLAAQSYPNVEVIVVDNGSVDGSREAVRNRHPGVRVIEMGANRGFSPGVNEGARAASGYALGLLNDDAVADPDWVARGVRPLLTDPTIGAVASRILSEDGLTLDFETSGAAITGHGFQLRHGEPAADPGPATRILFACGGAMFCPREVFLEVGGFDEDFFAYYEDVDLGWRLNVLGYTVLTAPDSIVRHAHHGTSSRFADAKRRFHMERNALGVVLKNVEDQNLGITLGAAAMLAAARATQGLDTGPWLFNDDRQPEPITVDGDGAATLAAVRGFLDQLPELTERRRVIQARRRRSDRDVLPLLRHPFTPTFGGPGFEETFRHVLDALQLEEKIGRPTRVLVLTEDVIGPRMSGPGIRALELCRMLSAEHEVTLLCANEPQPAEGLAFQVQRLTPMRVHEYGDWADAIMFQGFVLDHHPKLATLGKALIVDLYDPFHFEGLELNAQEEPHDQTDRNRGLLKLINAQLEVGDFFICASEKQRDMWIGHLSALGRISPAAYNSDPTLRRLIDVVPFGVSSVPPQRTSTRLRTPDGPIGPDDKVLLWGGGIYEWLDPLTPIRAMAKVVATDPSVKLFFLGTAHPSPGVPAMPMVQRARRLVRDLGLERNVIFNSDWVPYDERAGILLDADVGVTAHAEHVETAFSFRTRVLDYFWAGLPVVTSGGDAIADLVTRHGAGIAVPPEDADAFADAILSVLGDDSRRSAYAQASHSLAAGFTWDKVAEPLVAWCRDPRGSIDRFWTLRAHDDQRRYAGRGRVRRALEHIKRGEYRILALHTVNTFRDVLEGRTSRG